MHAWLVRGHGIQEVCEGTSGSQLWVPASERNHSVPTRSALPCHNCRASRLRSPACPAVCARMQRVCGTGPMLPVQPRLHQRNRIAVRSLPGPWVLDLHRGARQVQPVLRGGVWAGRHPAALRGVPSEGLRLLQRLGISLHRLRLRICAGGSRWDVCAGEAGGRAAGVIPLLRARLGAVLAPAQDSRQWGARPGHSWLRGGWN